MCMALQMFHQLVHFMYPAIPDFLRNLFMYAWRLNTFFQFVMCAAHAHAVDASLLHMCTDEWRLTSSTLCPLSLSHKKVQAG